MARSRLVCAANTVRQRVVQRAPLGRLTDHLVQPATLKRYRYAYAAFLAWLNLCGLRLVWEPIALDRVLALYLEHLWESGQSRGLAGDAISAVQFYGRLRRCFPHSWRLWNTWAKLELPSRAPPLPEPLWGAFVEHALASSSLHLAVVLIIGFTAFLRTTEMLTLERWQLEFGTGQLLLRLPITKSGKRHGNVEESVLIEEPQVVAVLWRLVGALPRDERLWPHSPAHFRVQWSALCAFFQVAQHAFMPYSLRRGGATAHFLRHRSYDQVCHKGRWAHLATCRIYVNQAREFLQQQALSPTTKQLVNMYNGRLLQRLRLVALPGRGAWRSSFRPDDNASKRTVKT
eukprot:3962999-Amphidinium_carterae.2